jgi:hypothetical protein
MLAADYPFLDVVWTMLIFFVWVMWFWLLFTVWADVFRRHDISGWTKAAWLLFTVVLPFLGVFVYLISQNEGMTQRNVERTRAQKAEFDTYVRQAAGQDGPASQIETAKKLLDDGSITQEEYETIKRKALTA